MVTVVTELPLDELLTPNEVVTAVTELAFDELLTLEAVATAVADAERVVASEATGETVVFAALPPAPPEGAGTTALPPQCTKTTDPAKTRPT